MKQGNISKVVGNTWHPGFLGTGHEALAVMDGVDLKDSDPFVVFMDDRLDLPGGPPVGGPHPHAGIETLTLVLEGNETDWVTGSFEIMTAGKGVIHAEEITSRQKIRILQVWIVLAPEDRYVEPSWQRILPGSVPAIKTDEYEIKVYSGSSNGLTSPLKNYTPFTLVDFKLADNAIATQEIPASYNGLIYVLDGSVRVGDKDINAGQTGWLTKTNEPGVVEITFRALGDNTRFVLYAGQPHNSPVVQHGPFVAGTMEEIANLYREFRNGNFGHVNELK